MLDVHNVVHAGGSHKMWMGFFTVINFVVSPGQMSVMAVVTVEVAVVSIHTFGQFVRVY